MSPTETLNMPLQMLTHIIDWKLEFIKKKNEELEKQLKESS